MDMSVRPPRVLTRSFPLMTVPYTAGAPCSYWTLTCLAVSSALHSLMGFLFVSPVVCSRLPSDSTSRWTPLPFSYPFPTAGQGRDFHPIERAPAGRTKIAAPGSSPEGRLSLLFLISIFFLYPFTHMIKAPSINAMYLDNLFCNLIIITKLL